MKLVANLKSKGCETSNKITLRNPEGFLALSFQKKRPVH